jgi:hypothetical protein
MDWTTGLIVQTAAGFVGAHAAAMALREYSFGWIGHSLAGLIAGALSGYFLQAIVLTMVNAAGDAGPPPTLAEAAVIEALTGAVVGAMAMAAVGFLITESSTKT